MTFLSTIQDIFSNLGMSMEVGITTIVLFGTLIFYAKDFKLGITLTFLASGLMTMLWFALDMNYVPALSMAIISLVIMTFTFYAVSKVGAKEGII